MHVVDAMMWQAFLKPCLHAACTLVPFHMALVG